MHHSAALEVPFLSDDILFFPKAQFSFCDIDDCLLVYNYY